MPALAAPVSAGAVGAGGRRRPAHRWRVVAALAVTQTVGYGTLYYAFAVLLQPMVDTLAASPAQVTGALTASVLAGAAIAVPVGRWLDRYGGRALMSVGSLVGTGLVVCWSQVRTLPQLYAVLVGIGLVGAMVLYEPAFAVVVSWFDAPQRGRALLAVTLVAGFASSIFMPLTGLLVDRHGWRIALLVLAAVHGLVTVPLHALVLRTPPGASVRSVGPVGPPPADHRAVVRAATRDLGFWILTVAFVAHAAAMGVMTVHLVGYLTSRGHPATFAATVAGLLGILSVTGRVLLTGVRRRLGMDGAATILFAAQAAAVLVLLLVARDPVGAILAVICFGLGFGISSLAAPAILADRYDTVAFGTIAGVLAVPVTLARATAPLAAALLLAGSGYSPVLVAVAVTCLIAAVAMLASALARVAWATDVSGCRHGTGCGRCVERRDTRDHRCLT